MLPGWSENEPSGQGSGAAAPSSQKEPAGQSWHAVWPVSFWKVPAVHALQVSAFVRLDTEPAAHGVGAVAPIEHALPAGQSWQPSCEVSPLSLPNVPAAHRVGTAVFASQ